MTLVMHWRRCKHLRSEIVVVRLHGIEGFATAAAVSMRGLLH